MKALQYSKPGKAQIIEVPIPKINSNQALVKNIVSNVSAGTEMSFYRGTAPQLNNRMKPNGLWEKCSNNLSYPMSSSDPDCWWMGYASVGEVVEVGREVSGLKTGDIVFTPQGHKEYHVVENNYYSLPVGLEPEHASFIALTQIAFNGFLDSGIKLLDNVVIVGLGTIGQLLVQMCRLAMVKVIAVDFLENRLNIAQKLGADVIINAGRDGDLAENVIRILGEPADVVIEVSGNSLALHDAVRCVRKDGQVTLLSFYQKPPANFHMEREFHHNRVTIRSSQIGGIAPCLSHQYTSYRCAMNAIKLIQNMDVASLISHRSRLCDYPNMLEIMNREQASCLAVAINYD